MIKTFSLFISILILSVICSAQVDPLPGSLQQWMHAEQYLNDKDGYRIPPRDHSILKDQHQATSGKWFSVKSYWIPIDDLDVASFPELMTAELSNELIRTINGKKFYRLFIHPESEEFYRVLTSKYNEAEPALAKATASSRTVLMTFKNRPNLLFFIKLSLNVKLGNVVRTIPRAETVQSIGLSGYIHEKEKSLHSNFKFIPETLGIIPKGWSRGGQIIRPIPPEIISGETLIVPLFSLTAGQADGTTLEKMIRASGQDPYHFVRKSILRPFVRGWTQWAIDASLSMEAHSQNVLIEIGKNGLPTGNFFHRDMGGMNLDLSSSFVTAKEKLKLPFFTNVQEDYQQNFSAEARETSLAIYFRERFLHNLDRELMKLDPRYRQNQLMVDLWVELQQALHEYTGIKISKLKVADLERKLPEIIKAASRARVFMRSNSNSCRTLFPVAN